MSFRQKFILWSKIIMKINTKNILFLVMLVLFSSLSFMYGCNKNDSNTKYMVSIEKSTNEEDNGVYIITYSDGTTQQLVIKDGEDGKDGLNGLNGTDGKDGINGINGTNGTNGKDGLDGKDGKDGQDGLDGLNGKDGDNLSILDIFNEYKNQNPTEDITFNQFLEKYFLLNYTDNSMVINKCLLSTMKVYSEFCVYSGYDVINNELVAKKAVSVSSGSAVIYKMDNDYTYIITNYHVVYSSNVNEDNNGNIARKVVGYIYGSESSPYNTEETLNGYPVYGYGEYGIELEYIGGTATNDIALLRTPTQNLLKVNPNATAVTLAKDYYVGQTAIAIGNPEDEGISVTQGVISVVDEDIYLNVGDLLLTHRSLRIDTPLYQGNSGGGLFNNQGELIGITNAGNTENQNVNYAIPLEIVKGTVENILYYASDENEETNGAYKILLGVSVVENNSKYVYNDNLGYGKIMCDVTVYEVVEDSVAQTLGFIKEDILKAIYVNDTRFDLYANFNISDAILTTRPNDKIKFEYERNGSILTTIEHTIQSSDLIVID